MKELYTDLAVVGGGPAGVCAALEAARLGLEVVLIHNRPVLGSNSSSEIRVWTRGAVGAGNLSSEEMGVLGALKMRNLYTNPDGNPLFWDDVLLDAVTSQPGLTLLLNTDVTEVEVRDRRLLWVQGSQQASERTWRVHAKMFIDATGDGSVGARAGVPYWIGEHLFRKDAAPEPTALLGSSILYYVKKEDHPVAFVPPSYAYSLEEVEALLGRGGRIMSETQSGSDCWWFEYGGLRNTIADAQDIAFELRRIVMGIWNYIKNSGRFNAACYTLEWVGSLPGMRESRRMDTAYLLSQEDVLRHTDFADGGFYGGWYMDFHPAEGIGSDENNCTQIPVNVYAVPLRCLYHADFPNLLFAGRNIGTRREAFVSTRVMNTCGLSGQAAAALAWGCLRWGKSPAALAPEEVERIRQTLLREDMFLPGLSNQDPEDLARDAAVTASSRYQPEEGPAAGWFSLEHGGFVACPCPDEPRGRFLVRADAPALGEGIVPHGVSTKDDTCAGDFMPWLWTFGGAIFGEDGSVTINSEAAVECVKWYQDMLAKGYIAMDTDRSEARQMFAQGKMAFYDDAVVAKGQAVSNGVAPEDVVNVCSAMPRPVLNAGDQPQSTMWGHMLVIFDKSEYKEQAADLALTLVSDDVAMDYFTNNGMPPVTVSASEKEEVKNDAYLNGFLESTATARLEETARMTNASEVKSVITEELQAALLGQKTAEQAVADMESRLNAL